MKGKWWKSLVLECATLFYRQTIQRFSPFFIRQHQAIENGGISIQQLQDIACQLDSRLGGEVRRLIQGRSFELGRTAGRTLLCSWYKFSLFEEGPRQEAASVLVKVLRHPDISLLPLAAEIERSSSKVLLQSPRHLTSPYCAAYPLEQVNYLKP